MHSRRRRRGPFASTPFLESSTNLPLAARSSQGYAFLSIVPHSANIRDADAHTYHSIFSKRSPGTSTLITVPGAGHNWIKPYDEPVNSIVSWLAQKQKERAARGFEEVKARL